MVRAFREFRSERKKRTTSGGCPQFPKRFSGNLPFHLTSNRNFRMFWLNGKQPISPCTVRLSSCESFLILIMLFLHVFLTPLFYIFMFYILLLLCFIFILMQKKNILTFSLIMMTEVRPKRRVFLPLVFTSNNLKSMESMVFDYK